MSAVPFGLDELHSCLVSVPPLDLKGMRLLREQPQLLSGTARVPRPQLIEAVTEIVAYTGRCAAAARSLANLTPVAICHHIVVEYGL